MTTSRAELERRWIAHWRAVSPHYRVARPHFGADFGAEGDDPIKRPTRAVAIATMAAALRNTASRLGKPLPDSLLRMMLGQKLGAEGAMPGLMGTTFAGTNNSGASQVPGGKTGAAWLLLKKAFRGWGAFSHKDSNPPGPHGGPYIGWYFMAPSVQDASDHWLTGYGGTRAVLEKQPSTPEEYARIMRDSGYYTGFSNDREKEIGNYAKAIKRGMGMIGNALETARPNDPRAFSVDPSQFRSLADRKITRELFDLAKRGGPGSAWGFLLPDSWDAMVQSNGVVWAGEPITSALHAQSDIVSSLVDTMKTHPLETAGVALAAVALGLVLSKG
jgi:hypothetical protein